MPTIITATAYLEVNGVPLATPAWRLQSLTPLKQGATLRGASTVVPAATGRKSNRRRVDEKTIRLGLWLFGVYDKTGTLRANARAGIELNNDDLQSSLGIASATGDGTVTAIWHRYAGDTKTAPVIPDLGDSIGEYTPGVHILPLRLTFPTGGWA